MKLLPPLLGILFSLPTPAFAARAGAEIDYLITAVGGSGCTLIRNGSRHDAQEAASHLRLKYRRGRRYAPTAELFIERLASKSSLSGTPYAIECPGSEVVPSSDWLTRRLREYREQQSSAR